MSSSKRRGDAQKPANKGSSSKRTRGGWGHSHNKQMPARRGGPAMMLTCETHREGACRNQGLEILQYYYERDAQTQAEIEAAPEVSSTSSRCSDTRNNSNSSGSIPEKKLSLEEELRTLKEANQTNNNSKRGKKGSNPQQDQPFQEYPTSVGGIVVFLFVGSSSEHQSILRQGESDASASKRPRLDATTQHVPAKVAGCTMEEDDCSKVVSNEHSASTVPRADDIKKNEIGTKICSASKTNEHEFTKTNVNDRTAPVVHHWSPLHTLEAVVADLTKVNASAPSSRFITRMIPLQATCSANLEEVAATVKRLLYRDILAVSSKTTKTRTTGDSLETTLDDCQTAEKVNETITNLPTSVTTFAIQTKRRFCEHLTRDKIIQSVATLVVESTAGADDASSVSQTKTPSSWKVDLKNPDYTIWVEVCQTLCGVSIFHKDYLTRVHNFQLAELRASAGNNKLHAPAVRPISTPYKS